MTGAMALPFIINATFLIKKLIFLSFLRRRPDFLGFLLRRPYFTIIFLSIFNEKFEISGQIGAMLLVNSGQKNRYRGTATRYQEKTATATKSATATAIAVHLYYFD